MAAGRTTLASPQSSDEWLEARRLVEEYAASLGIDLSFQDFAQELESLSRYYVAPDGCFMLARRDGEVVGCGAVRRVSESACEMKRLYVITDRRGEGVGRMIVGALVDRARSLGYRSMLLDTLPAMKSAQALYASFGFAQTAPYRHNPMAGATYWKLDFMSKTLDQTIALLAKTPRTLDALLRDLPDGWTRTSEGDDTWSAYDIVGHLIHGERAEWMMRARMILECGETRTFERFDRLAQERESQGKALGQLLATWAAHDLTHLHQISRVMAHQYRDAVGPWSVYLGVLQCAGHSR